MLSKQSSTRVPKSRKPPRKFKITLTNYKVYNKQWQNKNKLQTPKSVLSRNRLMGSKPQLMITPRRLMMSARMWRDRMERFLRLKSRINKLIRVSKRLMMMLKSSRQKLTDCLRVILAWPVKSMELTKIWQDTPKQMLNWVHRLMQQRRLKMTRFWLYQPSKSPC